MPPDPVGSESRQLVHASAASLGGRGVLIEGPSGSGKSDLLLRLLDGGAALIADDQVRMLKHEGSIWLAGPDALRGRVEVRGYGIVTIPQSVEAPLSLIITLVANEAGERLPEHASRNCFGLTIPCMQLYPHAASAVARIRTALTYPRMDEVA